MRRSSFVVLPILMVFAAAAAQPAPPPQSAAAPDPGTAAASLTPPASETEEIIVSGEREGPSFWRVHDADTEIYVLPSVTFLPKDFVWNDRGVAHLLERADEVLTTARVVTSAGDNARLMGAMLRTMTVNRGRIFMPKSETLETHVGPELAHAYEAAYARAKARAAARKKSKTDSAPALIDVDDAAVESEREDLDPKRAHPFLQANQLWRAAVDGAGLKTFGVIERRVSKLADRANVPVRAMIEKNLAFSDAKKFLTSMKDFSSETDRACISDSVDFADNRLGRAYLVAEAWARGDVDALTKAAEAPRESACMQAVSRELGGLATFGGATLAEVSGPELLAGALEASLKKPGVRLAIVHADGWLSKGGALETLRARGVAVDDPQPPKSAAETSASAGAP